MNDPFAQRLLLPEPVRGEKTYPPNTRRDKEMRFATNAEKHDDEAKNTRKQRTFFDLLIDREVTQRQVAVNQRKPTGQFKRRKHYPQPIGGVETLEEIEEKYRTQTQ